MHNLKTEIFYFFLILYPKKKVFSLQPEPYLSCSCDPLPQQRSSCISICSISTSPMQRCCQGRQTWGIMGKLGGWDLYARQSRATPRQSRATPLLRMPRLFRHLGWPTNRISAATIIGQGRPRGDAARISRGAGQHRGIPASQNSIGWRKWRKKK